MVHSITCIQYNFIKQNIPKSNHLNKLLLCLISIIYVQSIPICTKNIIVLLTIINILLAKLINLRELNEHNL